MGEGTLPDATLSPPHQSLFLRVHSPCLTWCHTHLSKQLAQRGGGGWVGEKTLPDATLSPPHQSLSLRVHSPRLT